MKHKHAEILRAIAEDKDVKLHSRHNAESPWTFANHDAFFYYLSEPRHGDFRIVPKTIKIGDVDVPEPMRIAPEVGTKYWYISFYDVGGVSACFWCGSKTDNQLLKLGTCHLTEAAARTHAEAIIKNNGGVL